MGRGARTLAIDQQRRRRHRCCTRLRRDGARALPRSCSSYPPRGRPGTVRRWSCTHRRPAWL